MDGQRTDRRHSRQAPSPAWTIGHSTLDLDGLFERLSAHRIERLADVRRYPASRRHPQFNRETLTTYLDSRGIEYRWFEGLGGRRAGLPERESPNRGLEVPGFRRYADYTSTPEFAAAFEDLVEWLEGGRTAILCAELLWWQCHRRLIADRLVARGGTVYHIRDAGTADRHVLWDVARVTPDGLFYPPVQTELEIE